MDRSRGATEMEAQRLRKSGYSLLGMTRYVLYTALAILSLSSMNYEAALDWLQSSRRRGAKLTRGTSRDALRRGLEEIVLRSSVADIVTWGDRENAPDQAALRTATTLLRRKGLVAAVATANYRRGRPMSSVDVINAYNNSNDPTSTRGSVLGNVSLPHHKNSPGWTWMKRWRQGHHTRVGRIRFGEPISIPEKRRKVLAKFG